MLKVGIIGLGNQSLKEHLPAVYNSEKLNLTCVCDSDVEKTNLISKKYGVKGYTSYRKMLSEEKLDFIILAVPHKFHFEITSYSIKKGIHVFKEKPFTISFKEAKIISNLKKKYGSKVYIYMKRKFNPLIYYFNSYLHDIGTIYNIDMKYTLNITDPFNGWRNNFFLSGGGCIIDMGYHIIDLLILIFGLPNNLYTLINKKINITKQSEVEHSAKILFSYNNKESSEIIGSINISRVERRKEEYIHVIGEKGILFLDLYSGILSFKKTNGKNIILTNKNKNFNYSKLALEYFYEIIKEKKENIDSPENHLKHMAFITAAYNSAKKNVPLNPYDILRKKTIFTEGYEYV